jgi:hypothetical protein
MTFIEVWEFIKNNEDVPKLEFKHPIYPTIKVEDGIIYIDGSESFDISRNVVESEGWKMSPFWKKVSLEEAIKNVTAFNNVRAIDPKENVCFYVSQCTKISFRDLQKHTWEVYYN